MKKPISIMVLVLISILCGAGIFYLRGLQGGNNKQTNSRELYRAALNGNVDSVKRLLEEGADPNTLGGRDKDFPALVIAVTGSGKPEVVQALLDKGADINAQIGGAGATALIAGVMSVPDTTSSVSSGTSVDVASLASKVRCIGLLLERGADVNIQDKDGRTALMWAVASSNVVLVEALLSKGADVNIKNNIGETALDYAEREIRGAFFSQNGKQVKKLLQAARSKK